MPEQPHQFLTVHTRIAARAPQPLAEGGYSFCRAGAGDTRPGRTAERGAALTHAQFATLCSAAALGGHRKSTSPLTGLGAAEASAWGLCCRAGLQVLSDRADGPENAVGRGEAVDLAMFRTTQDPALHLRGLLARAGVGDGGERLLQLLAGGPVRGEVVEAAPDR